MTNGTAVDNGDGTHTFTPTAGFNGTMSITYDVNDGAATVNAGTDVTVLNAIDGTNTADTLAGTADADHIEGLAGDDSIDGGDGDDTILGGDGNDTIIGGVGSDTLTGGAGADTFVFEVGDEGLGGQTDVITDFSMADGDKIDLSGLLDAVASTTGAELDSVIDLTQGNDGEDFVEMAIDVDNDGNVDLTVQVRGVTLDDLYGADTTGVSEADILQKMIDDQTLQGDGTP